MLDAWERSTVDDVIDRVEAGGGDVNAKLRHRRRLVAAGRLDIDAYFAGDESAVAGLCAALEGS